MSINFSGTAQRITYSDSNIDANARTSASIWVRRDADADFRRFFMMNNDAASAGNPAGWQMAEDFDSVDSFNVCASNGSSGWGAQSSGRARALSINNNQWYHICITVSSDSGDGVKTLEAAFLDGVAMTFDAGDTFTKGTSNELVYVGARSDNAQHFDGDLAEATIWNDHLFTAEEALALAAGAPATSIDPENIKFYAPLQEIDGVDIATGTSPTKTGTPVTAEHAPITSSSFSFSPTVVDAGVPRILPKRFHPDFRNPKVKPIGPVELDRSDPFSRGIVGCWMMNSGGEFEVDLSPTRAKAEFRSSPLRSVGSVGKIIDFSGSNDELRVSPKNAALNITGDLTIVILFKLNDMGGERYLIGTDFASEGTESQNCIYSLAIQSDGDMTMFWEHGTGTNVTPRSASSGIAADEWDIASITRRSNADSEVDFYMDGVLVSTVTSLTNASGGEDSPLFIAGLRETATNQMSGDLGFTYVYDRRFTAEEHRLINEAPYRLLKPLTPPIYFTGVAAAPAVGRIMSSLAKSGGLAGLGGIAGPGGGLAG